MLASLELMALSAIKCRMYSSTASRGTKFFRDKNIKSIKPASVRAVKAVPKKEKESEEKIFEKLSSDFGEDDFMNLDDEANPASYRRNIHDYVKEGQIRWEKGKQKRIIQNHFKHLEPQEISLLTYAEKENIRYLMETEPEEWTPEAITQAYPISLKGVEKLMKSFKRLVTLNVVIKHDLAVLARIQKIKSGSIPMTDELAAKLNIRELIPVKVGELGINNSSVFVRPEPDTTGEFARLVAPPIAQKNGKVINHEYEPVINKISDGDLCDPRQLGDGKQSMDEKRLKKILQRSKLMTLSDFEKKMSRRKDELSEDMKYMLSLNENDTSEDDDHTQTRIKPVQVDQVAAGVSFSKTSFPSIPSRFKVPGETGEIAVNLEGQKAYIYHPETGVQRPYNSSTDKIRARIEIPPDSHRPGAVYKVNDCYYDDEGEFLYRVI